MSTPRPGKSTLRRLVRIFSICACLLAALVFITPYVLSAEFFRSKIERAASEVLEVPVRLEDYSLSWFSGFSMNGLSVGNPDGFPQDHPLLVLRSMRGDLSFLQLLRGRVDLSGTAEGLEIRVHQDADGATNIDKLTDLQIDVDERDRREVMAGARWSGLASLRLDLNLRDGLVEFSHPEHGVLESLRKLNGTIGKEFGETDLRLSMDAEIDRPGLPDEPGRLQLTVDVDTTGQRPLEIDLDTNGLDLLRYRPLIALVTPAEQITSLEGIVSGTLRGHYDYHRTVSMNGSLTVERPILAGALTKGLELRAPRWVINPHVEIELGGEDSPSRLAADGTFVDLGFLSLNGIPADQMAARGQEGLGLDFTLDLDDLGTLGDLPVKTTGGSVRGTLLVSPTGGRPFDPATLSARGSLDLPSLRGGSWSLTGFRADFNLQAGVLELAARQGLLNAGTVGLQARADLLHGGEIPLSIDLLWEGGNVTADAVAVLRYAVPLLAGLQAGPQLDFQSSINAELHVFGPALPKSGEGVLAWLNGWQGNGQLRLSEGSFTPAQQLRALLAVTGNESRLQLDELETEFTVSKGYVETKLMELESKGRRYGLSGRTSLAGEVDYAIDLTKLLEGHGTGDRIREALGNKPLLAHLKGDLDRPVLNMPDITSSLQSALENAIERGLRDLLKRIR